MKTELVNIKIEGQTLTQLFQKNEQGISAKYAETMDAITRILAESLADQQPDWQVLAEADTWASADGQAHATGKIYLCPSQIELSKTLEEEGQSSCGRYFVNFWRFGSPQLPNSVRKVCPNCGADKDLGFNHEGTHASCQNGNCWSGNSVDLLDG